MRYEVGFGEARLEDRGLRYVDGRKVVGRGASSVAYLCENEAGDRYVDKIVDAGKLTADQRSRAQREALLLQSIRHPHVVRCTDAWITEHRVLHIVTEYCSGGTLSASIEQQVKAAAPFPQKRGALWVAQLASALAHLHSKRVLHRDVKTANVFLTAALDCKLGDFGASRQLVEGEDMARTVAGTPYYFSPEICRAERYSSRTDIWSLGVVVYEICAPGQRPFNACSLPRLLKSITELPPAPLPDAAPTPLARLVASMLQKKESDRPSAARLCRDPFLAAQLGDGAVPPEDEEAEYADDFEAPDAADAAGSDGHSEYFHDDAYEDDFEPADDACVETSD